MRKTFKILFAVLIIVLVIVLAFKDTVKRRYIYIREYNEFVEVAAKKYETDEALIYAIIKTESNFDEKSTSEVGARGLMQIMPDAFEWVKFKKKDESDISFDDMYNPESNIDYCVYLVSYLMKKYDKDISLVAAAYHSGMGRVDGWIEDKSVSVHGENTNKFPSSVTNHYVNKVIKAYNSYKSLYYNE